MSDYEPGTVAVATVRGVKGVRVMRTDVKGVGWYSAAPVGGDHWHPDGRVTDIRPLAVLDLDDAPIAELRKRDLAAARYYANMVEGRGAVGAANVIRWLADQIEAQTKPRIPEPSIYGVVTASHRQKDGKRSNFVRIVDEGDGRRWVDETYEADLSKWDDLIDPALVREGVE